MISQSGQYLLHHVPMDIGKAKVTAIESIGQSLMVDSTEVQNRGMKVVKMTRILHRPITKRIGFAIVNTTSHSTPREPSGEGVRIMVTTPASLGIGGSPKFTTTHHQGGIQQPALLEVGQECCDSLIGLQGKLAMVGCNIGVSIPTLCIASSPAVNLDETNARLKHATGREALPTKLFCDGMVQPVERPDVGRFLIDRQHFGQTQS